MDFIEYIEKTCDIKLLECQKQFLRDYDKARQNGKVLYYNPARGSRTSRLYLVALYKVIKSIIQGGEKKECEINTSTG